MRRLTREHRIAETLQNALITDVDENLHGYHLLAAYRPSSEAAGVGGDFYDVATISDGKYLIAVGDVSGKGLDAAVYTAMCKYMLRAYAQDYTSPAEVLEQLNRALSIDMPEDMFVTIFCGFLDTSGKKLIYASGGHEPLIRYSRRAGVEILPAEGRAVGIQRDSTYTNEEVSTAPGDLLLVYTDGITEARSNGLMLGVDGLASLLAEIANEDDKRLCAAIYERAEAANGGKLKDDAALMLIRRLE